MTDALFNVEPVADAQPGSAASGLTFVAHGAPKPKGSLKHVGRGVLQEQLAGSKPWRETVKWAALEAIAAREGTGDPFATLSGPVQVDVVFSFPKPKSAPKTRRTWPCTRSSGDVDKLLRNLFDALVDAGVLTDDSQVVDERGRKAYVGEHPSDLTAPGARVVVRPLDGAA